MVMGLTDHPDKSLAVERQATDESNWPLWKATLKSYFESRNLVKHVEGVIETGEVIYTTFTDHSKNRRTHYTQTYDHSHTLDTAV